MITLSHLLILKNQLKERGLICVIVEEYFFGFLLVGLSCSTQKCELIKLQAINILKFNSLSITMPLH